MAVKICPDCGGKVSMTRMDCPHCGYHFAETAEKIQCPECEAWVIKNEKGECPICAHIFEETTDTVLSPFSSFADSVLDLGLDDASIDAAMSQGNNVLKMEPIPGMMKHKVTGCINEYVTEIEIPETVHVIGKGAFEGLQYLKKVTISSSVQIIEDEAFAECPNLKIAIPEGIICGKDVIRGTKTDNDRIARERAEAERKAREKAEAERKAKEEAAKPKKTAQGTVLFGKYPQGSKGEVKPIEWKILKREGTNALLISKYGLDAIPYNTKCTDITWKDCTLRAWLNDTFLNQAFNGEEQKNILQTQVSAHMNPEFSTDPGKATTDKVFLLSIPEANDYFKSDEDRRCAPTAYLMAYLIAQGNLVASEDDDDKTADGEAAWFWWLRSPGADQDGAAGVDSDGSVFYYGEFVNDNYDAVRPALWVNLES